MTPTPAKHRTHKLLLRAVSFKEACAFIDAHHRHHTAPRGHKFSIGATTTDGTLVAVAIIGRPVARHLDDGLTLEVLRLATLGTGARNACSTLYATAWRAARAIGYRRIITYTQADETGASLRASGWNKIRDLPPRPGWNSPTRPRRDRGTDHIARTLWQARIDPPPAANDAALASLPQAAAAHRACRDNAPGRPRTVCVPALPATAPRASTSAPHFAHLRSLNEKP